MPNIVQHIKLLQTIFNFTIIAMAVYACARSQSKRKITIITTHENEIVKRNHIENDYS